jgi:ATP-dependent RNA helicase RhlE
MKFEKYHISEDIKKNLAELGFKKPTDIQFKSIPSILKGEDVLAIAQTGTGKTLAFAIPVIDKIHSFKSSKRAVGIKCLVMVPTRELAMQISDVFNQLSRHTKVKSFVVYGGVDQDAQIKKLQAGIDILIATPGRMFDLISQGFIKIKGIHTLVLDEADRMLDKGFIKDIQSVKKMLPGKHQTLFFSATINKQIKKLAYSQVKSTAIRIQISPEDPVSKNVSHFVMFVEMDDKRVFLERFINENPDRRIIVFVRTRVRAERVANAMKRVGITVFTIHGEKDQAHRSHVMESFKKGESNILIATDVSARGIDIPDVHFVINYDMPVEPESYVHRIGRTGRGFSKGIAISFCSKEEKGRLEAIQELVHKKIEEIKISKKNYARTIDRPSGEKSAEDLIRAQEAWENKKGKKKKKRRATGSYSPPK